MNEIKEVTQDVSLQPADPGMARHETPSALFREDEAQKFRGRWSDVQASFVDEPRRAVQEADQLVDDVIQRLSLIFSEERGKMEVQWGRGGDVSTEDLRVTLQRYRSFFNRLLSV
jgi:hypothetical protein